MSIWYIPSRVAAHVGVLFLALVVEFVVFGSDYSVTNAFLGPFFFASILPVWRSNIALKVRGGALAAGAAIAVLFGALHLALLSMIDSPNAAPVLVGLSTVVGVVVGWSASSRIVRPVVKIAQP
jgi:hypothetical protein